VKVPRKGGIAGEKRAREVQTTCALPGQSVSGEKEKTSEPDSKTHPVQLRTLIGSPNSTA